MVTTRDLTWPIPQDKRDIFERLFPLGAEPTVENARRAATFGLSLRCAAMHLMTPRRLVAFQQTANELFSLYLENTAETRRELQSHSPCNDRVAYDRAYEAHERNKRDYWEGYLDGLATAFSREF